VLIESVGSETALASMRGEWDDLLGRSSANGPFLRHAWLSRWWESFGDELGLNILTCREERGGSLLGVAPLYRRATKQRPRAFHSMCFMGDVGVGSVGLSAFAVPELEGDIFSLFRDHLFHDGVGWDVLDLRFMDSEQPFVRSVSTWRRARIASSMRVCPVVALPADWEAYLGGLSKHMRHEVRRSLRRVAERGLELEIVKDESDLPQAFEDFVCLHVSRMREKLGPDYDLAEPQKEFTLGAMTDLLAEGRLRLMFLRTEDRRIGVLYLFRYGDTMFAEQSGFDGGEAKQDVLRSLWAKAIEAAIDENCTALNLLLGDQSYKYKWGVTSESKQASIRVYGDSLAASAARARDAWRDLSPGRV